MRNMNTADRLRKSEALTNVAAIFLHEIMKRKVLILTLFVWNIIE